MSEVVEIHSQDVACADPECGGIAEPEQDGENLFFECTTCGYQFGWQKQPQPTVTSDAGGSCAIGVPESLRRAASAGMEEAIGRTLPLPATPVTIGRRKT